MDQHAIDGVLLRRQVMHGSPDGNKKEAHTGHKADELGRRGGSAACAAKTRHAVDPLNGGCGWCERMSRQQVGKQNCVIGRSRSESKDARAHDAISSLNVGISWVVETQ